MGTTLANADFFTQMTFPGLFNGRMAFVEDDGDGERIYRIPAWMCETMHSANMGYGSDQEVPCAGNAAYIVTYGLCVLDWEASENSDSLHIWVEVTERVCKTCFEQMVSYVDANHDEIRIVHIVDISTLRDIPTRPVDMRKYVSPPKRDMTCEPVRLGKPVNYTKTGV